MDWRVAIGFLDVTQSLEKVGFHLQVGWKLRREEFSKSSPLWVFGKKGPGVNPVEKLKVLHGILIPGPKVGNKVSYPKDNPKNGIWRVYPPPRKKRGGVFPGKKRGKTLGQPKIGGGPKKNSGVKAPLS